MDQTPILADLLRQLIILNGLPQEYPLKPDSPAAVVRENAMRRLEELHIWLADFGTPADPLKAIVMATNGTIMLNMHEQRVPCSCGGPGMSPHHKLFSVHNSDGEQQLCSRGLVSALIDE